MQPAASCTYQTERQKRGSSRGGVLDCESTAATCIRATAATASVIVMAMSELLRKLHTAPTSMPAVQLVIIYCSSHFACTSCCFAEGAYGTLVNARRVGHQPNGILLRSGESSLGTGTITQMQKDAFKASGSDAGSRSTDLRHGHIEQPRTIDTLSNHGHIEQPISDGSRCFDAVRSRGMHAPLVALCGLGTGHRVPTVESASACVPPRRQLPQKRNECRVDMAISAARCPFCSCVPTRSPRLAAVLGGGQRSSADTSAIEVCTRTRNAPRSDAVRVDFEGQTAHLSLTQAVVPVVTLSNKMNGFQ